MKQATKKNGTGARRAPAAVRTVQISDDELAGTGRLLLVAYLALLVALALVMFARGDVLEWIE